MQQMTIFPMRVVFSKTGRAKYISHLDTMRTFTRALRRSGLPLWYTQGFNPHLYLTFPLPLALGVESLCETVDFRLTMETDAQSVKQAVGDCLPPGFEAISAAEPMMAASDIAWAEYAIRLEYPDADSAAARAALEALFARPSIEVMKKGKKGEKLTDIRPHTALLRCAENQNSLDIVLRLAAGSTLNISPGLLLNALEQDFCAPSATHILRTAVLDAELRGFA